MRDMENIHHIQTGLMGEWLEWGGDYQPQEMPVIPQGFKLHAITSLEETFEPMLKPPLDLDVIDERVILNDRDAHEDMEAIVKYAKSDKQVAPVNEAEKNVWLLGPVYAEEVFRDRYNIDKMTYDCFLTHYEELWREQHPEVYEPMAEVRILRRVK